MNISSLILLLLDPTFDDAARLADGVDSQLDVGKVVERVEDPEHVHPVLHRQLAADSLSGGRS